MSKVVSVLSAVAVMVLLMLLGGTLIHLTASESPVDPSTPSSVGTAFTYQGYLTYNQGPANGPFDLTFSLYDDPEGGSQVGTTITRTITITDSLLSLDLDFGGVFEGTALWLEIGVRPAGDAGPYATLLPRQRLAPTPLAIFASSAPWTGLTGIPGGFGDGMDDDTLASLTCAAGQISEWNGNAWACGEDNVGTGTAGWSLTGNVSTTAGTNFLGTTDNQALEFRVNGSRALRLEPDDMSPNILGGYSGNSVGVDVYGATIGGGGRESAINQLAADFGAIGGGAGNTSEGYAATIGGGEGNRAGDSYATVGGGSSNTAGGSYAIVGGGRNNTGTGTLATIAGGGLNQAGAAYATVGGGGANVVSDTFGTVSGGQANEVTGAHASVGGGSYNIVAAAYGTIAGGGPADLGNPTTSNNRVYDQYGTVGGGGGNLAGSDDGDLTSQYYATVSGGEGNRASDSYATVGGGVGNAAGSYGATVGGGSGNAAGNNYATVAGGGSNTASGRSAMIAGGQSNTAASTYATIGGGLSNVVTATFGTIPGGFQNFVGGSYGLAAGQQARVEHDGAFVWSDSSSIPFASTGPDQFLIDASGGVGIGTDSPTHMLTVAGDAAIRSGAAITVGAIVSYPSMLQAPRALHAVGDLLYAAGYATSTLSIWNVSDPAAQVLVGYTTFQLQGPVDLQVVGDRAYLASQNRDMLTILDVSDPSNPSHVGDTTEYLDNPQGVHVSGKYAYVASIGSDGRYDGLTVFDVTDAPAEIAATGFITTYLQGTSDVFVVDNYAYVTSRNNNRLVVFDVSDPRDPTPVSYTEESLVEPVRVYVSGIYAYVVAEGANRVVVFDVSNPAQISYLGQVTTSLTHPRSLYVSGDRAYAAYAGNAGTSERCGLAVLDISDPAAVTVLNVIDMSNWLNGDLVPPKPVAVAGSGDRIYVANEGHDSVTIFEIDGLEASAIRTGELQVAHLEVEDYAAIEGNLGVRGGLNVGPGGALVQGTLSVEGSGDSYIQGRLGIGPVATVITRSVSPTESEEIVLRHPTHQLDVDGEVRFRVNDHNHLVLRSQNTGSDEDAYIDFVDFAYPDLITPSARIEFDAADPITHSTSIRFYTQGAGDGSMRERLRIDKDGDLLPALSGEYSLGSPDLRWADVWTVGGLHQLSDGRYKENVRDLIYGLEEVRALRPVIYSMIGHPDQGPRYGLIAQEVREVLPEAVSGSEDDDGTLSMDYGELVPVLVKAVQEQQEQIDNQADQIAALEARLAELEDGQPDQAGAVNPLTTFGFGGLLLGAVAVVGIWRNRDHS